eukprot:15366881-Ditylum_brightwellii.AAC.1
MCMLQVELQEQLTHHCQMGTQGIPSRPLFLFNTSFAHLIFQPLCPQISWLEMVVNTWTHFSRLDPNFDPKTDQELALIQKITASGMLHRSNKLNEDKYKLHTTNRGQIKTLLSVQHTFETTYEDILFIHASEPMHFNE